MTTSPRKNFSQQFIISKTKQKWEGKIMSLVMKLQRRKITGEAREKRKRKRKRKIYMYTYIFNYQTWSGFWRANGVNTMFRKARLSHISIRQKFHCVYGHGNCM